MTDFLNGQVRVLIDDITAQQVDAVVNAANSTLLGGAGVDGAIHRAGGLSILEECRELRRTRYPEGLPAGDAVITTGGNLPARFVIHTVGPIYGQHDGREAELLAACYSHSLTLAAERGLQSIAFPAISTGAYGYPKAEAAAVSSMAIRDFLLLENVTDEDVALRSTLTEVRLIFFQPRDARVFVQYQKFEKL